uniref:Uncharacterized protein n=1 Tax=Euplotes crassus TaxID=5936 RepID=A0A7S3NUF7_EUPCR|mmetsp:Transcript_21409/g.21046  ORF Transcript_21409/g.21046 Transcript_21409/m.21046 type:complete len:151 (+) Transcript_21409:208-660(+)
MKNINQISTKVYPQRRRGHDIEKSKSIQMQNIEKNLHSKKNKIDQEFDKIKKYAKSPKPKKEKSKKWMFKTEKKLSPPLQAPEGSLDSLTKKMERLLAQVPLDKREQFLANFVPNTKNSTESSKFSTTKDDRRSSEYTLFVNSSNEQSGN